MRNMNDGTDRRRRSRRSLNSVVTIQVGAHVGRLLDVSDIGLRFEVDWPAEDQIPSTMTLVVGTQRVAIPVIVAWKLQEDDRPWICGALVSADAKAEWVRLLATLDLMGDDHNRRNFLLIKGGGASTD